MQATLAQAQRCVGDVVPPGDKSITHRALLFAALATGTSEVVRPLQAGDTDSTVRVLRQLGVRVVQAGTADPKDPAYASAEICWQVTGIGAGRFPHASAHPDDPGPTLDCGNSGTTLRLLAGVLAGRGAGATLTGDASLRRRPMARVAAPLRQLGAEVHLGAGGRAPLRLVARPGAACTLRAAALQLDVASAQVKSAALLAALGARGTTTLHGALASRDHTERLLPYFGAQLASSPGGGLQLQGPQPLKAARLQVPGDPSSAAFFWAAAAVVPGGDVTVRGVSLNPTRLGFLRLLGRMGARIDVQPEAPAAEPTGTVRLRQAPLRGVALAPAEVAATIDELPLVAVVASCAEGTTAVRGASELRHKECDRIAAMAHNLAAMGADVTEHADGFAVRGPAALRGARLSSYADHRVVMATAVAALVARGDTCWDDVACVAVSYPDFFAALHRLTGAVQLA